MERRLWVGERAPKPWVGEPGRLSLEDSERFSDDKLRLVCRRFDCLVILRNKELRFLLLEKDGDSTQEALVVPLTPFALQTLLHPPS